MTGFWLVATLLLLLGYVFFIPAFYPKPRADMAPRRDRLNILLHRQRQSELALEEADGQNREWLEAESARNLLNDLDAAPEQAHTDTTRGRIPLIMTLCLLPMVILVLYLGLGRPDMIEGQPSPSTALEDNDINASIQKLAERLRNDPADVDGWMLLGRSLQTIRQYDKAAEAYGYALKLEADNLDIKALYAESLAEANQGRLAGKPAELVQEVLSKDPQHKNGLWLAALAAAERGDKKQAVAHWQVLKSLLPANSPDAQQIDAFIAEMQGQSPVASAARPATVPDRKPATAARQIRVAVSLAPELEARTSPDDALFIFARAAEGPPMPLAVVRKQVRDLPVEVSLDDTLSMMPGMNLSSFERLILGARISKTGKPTPTPGDLQGLSQPVVAENGQSYRITITEVVGGGR
jgi:cytochrome c-type biogenesis protein CcmH